ncbi:heme exporter protein CcmD [uncultured Sulfitobacter sp.]|uniref:heme exporter protein CcmD n=1 Tax=uncultured Sulfitobacter sp. TaxID=191468 RepID=UPI002638F7DD|nr:heme exporter protein CcmD [uncultured Sulfitobacter sp.]
MPELGKYAFEVLSAYGLSLLLIVALLAVTLRRGRRARAALRQIEAEARPDGKS